MFLDRQSALRWARETIAASDVVFLDTETTGVRPTDDVVDIAVVSTNGDVLMQQLVRPARSIPADTSAFNGITNKMVSDAPTFDEIYPNLTVLLSDRVVVAYNVEFDRSMLNAAATRRGLPELSTRRWDCAMEAYAAFNGESSWHRPGFRWMSLEKATSRLGIAKPTHRALADAEACRAVVRSLAAITSDS